MAGKKGLPRSFWGIASSVHIKKNTAGTSNELSLSVLDGLKTRADDRLGEADPKVKLGDLSLFTVPSKKERKAAPHEGGSSLPSVASRPTKASARKAPRAQAASAAPTGADLAGKALDLSFRGAASRRERSRARALADPEREIRRRKKNRRLRRILAGGLAAAGCACLVAFAAFSLANAYEKNQQNLAVLGKAFDEIEQADAAVLSVDDAVMSETGELSADDIERFSQSMDGARLHLDAACGYAQEAAASLGDSAARDAALRVEDAADARRSMMQYAEALMQADHEAKESVEAAEASWDAVVQADALMKEAASLVADTTKENVEASQEKTEQAQDMLGRAQTLLDEAAQGYPSADFSLFSELIAAKVEQNGYALESDKAIYIQDKATAESYNELYNQADEKARSLAAQLPDKPAQPILDRLDAQTAETRALYQQARKRAAESDAFLRDYLGQSGE